MALAALRSIGLDLGWILRGQYDHQRGWDVAVSGKGRVQEKIVMATPDFVGESARSTENGIFPESDIGS